MQSTTTDRLLTPAETAERLRLHVTTLAGQRQRGDGPPYVRLGRKCVRYREADIEAWLESRTIGDIERD